jgi:hypothetical protein
MMSDLAGWLAIVATPVFGGLVLYANRRSPAEVPPAGWVEAALACLFVAAFGAAAAYIADPDGWLTTGTALTDGPGR